MFGTCPKRVENIRKVRKIEFSQFDISYFRTMCQWKNNILVIWITGAGKAVENQDNEVV